MKIIFLDIDGVLNHDMWYEKSYIDKTQNKVDSKLQHLMNSIDPNSISLLNEIIEKTDAKVVISSSWRKYNTVEVLQECFSLKGFVGEIIGLTPVLYFRGVEGYNYSVPRGNEIKAWLEINKGILGVKMSKVKYVIFDDDSDMLLWQRENYFWVDPYCGLTPNIIYKSIRFLLK